METTESTNHNSLTLPGNYDLEKSFVASTKKFFYTHFEKVIAGAVILLTVLTHFLVVNKMVFLGIYFLPSLLAGYILGRRGAISVAFFSVAIVVYFVVLSPAKYLAENAHASLTFNLTLWGCLLILTSTVVGSLYEQNEKKNIDFNKDLKKELNTAYEGVLEILIKFIGSVDKYTQDHSQRVAELSTQMAAAMNLPERQTETIRVAALLHDIGKVDVSSEVILKMTKLSEKELQEIKTHVEKGEVFLKPFQRLFKDAVTIVLNHHKYYDNSGYGEKNIVLDQHSKLSLGIVTIADAYDAMISDRPYRSGKTPREAVTEIKHLAGKQFDPVLVEVFLAVMQDRLESN